MGRRRQSQRAFSLIELMIAVATAILLLSVAVPSYQAYIERAHVARAISDIGSIALTIDKYFLANNDRLPADLLEVGKQDLVDPWGNPYRYLPLIGGGNNGQSRKNRNLVPINGDYDLYSTGKDGDSKPPLTAKASRDDVIRAANGQFVGLAADY